MTKEKYMIALDMDGTLLNSRGKITEHTLNVLKSLMDAGHDIVPASGRAFPILPKEIKGLAGIRYAVLENGAVLWDWKKAAAHMQQQTAGGRDPGNPALCEERIPGQQILYGGDGGGHRLGRGSRPALL